LNSLNVLKQKTQQLIKQPFNRAVLPMALVLSSLSAQAVIMRHDTDPVEYLLDSSEYQSVLHSQNASATLIAERWVLTAAHAFDESMGHSIEQFGKITIMGQEYGVKQVHIHPGYKLNDDHVANDIALVELEESVFIIEPTPVYEQSDEVGKTMKLAGYGHTGNGVDGITEECFPCELRGADNLVYDANEQLLGVKFDDPANGESLPLEGVGGPGDSGGPLFVETELGRFVAGVSAVGDVYYGKLEGYTRVSTHLDWLFEVMADEYPGSYAGPTYSENQTQTQNQNQSQTGDDSTEEENRSGGGAFGFIILTSLGGALLLRRNARRER